MISAAEDIKSVWTSIFRRKGGDGEYTRLFDNMGPSEQSYLHCAMDITVGEMPVIGSYLGLDNWLALTTERLVWSINGEHRSVDITKIRDAIADLHNLRRSGMSKTQMQELKILTIDGDTIPIRIESGPPLSGIWSILKNAGAKNRALEYRG